MMFENPFNLFSDRDGLLGIAQEIADHAYAAGVRQLDKQSHVRPVPLQHGVRGMPHALPTENATGWLDLSPRWIKGVTMMAYPFRPELPGTAAVTALHQ
ncbi:hypothetical protein BRSPCE3_02540 [Bradyrhizobium sp. Ce-3]|nr:hypothetical protein BRSPCE3_02540 [Bradyrhizobium sp. Ce-3]